MIDKNKSETFFGSALETRLINRLNLNFDQLNSKDEQLSLYQNLLNQESKIYKQIYEILTSDMTLEQKQDKLELFSYENQNYQVNMNYYLPPILIPKVREIDEYFLNPDILNAEGLKYFLPSEICKHFKYKTKLSNNLTKLEKQSIERFKLILQLFHKNNQSFGLFLVYNLVYIIRKELLKKDSIENFSISKEIILKDLSINDKEAKAAVDIDIPFVKMVSSFGSSLLLNHTQSTKLTLAMLTEKTTTDSGENLTAEQRLLYDKLINENIGHDSEIERDLGQRCLLILEIVRVIGDRIISLDGYKTQRIVQINKPYISGIFSIPADPRKLPMVTRPRFWEIDSNSPQNLCFGGYRYNERLCYPGVLNRNKKGIATFSKYELEAINYLQSNYYQVNQDFLRLIEKNSRNSILEYLKQIPRFDIFFDQKGDSLSLKTVDHFLLSDMGYKSLISKLHNHERQASKGLKLEIAKTRQKLKKEYDVLFNLLLQFIHGYVLSDLFSGYDLFFCIFLDARGRMYYSSSGSNFGLQAGGFGKHALELRGNTYNLTKPNTINYVLPTCKAYQKHASQISPGNFFETLKFANKISTTTLGQDASCSGTSIICGLIGDLHGMIATNILYETETGIPKLKNDIYTSFSKHLEINYPQTYLELKPYFHGYEKFQAQLSKKHKIEEDQFIVRVNEVLSNIKNDVLKRSSVKTFVMCKNYSQTDIGRSRFIFTNSDFFIKDSSPMLDHYICRALGKWINKEFDSCLPNVSSFCKLLLRRINHEEAVTLVSGLGCNDDYLSSPPSISVNGQMKYEQPYEEIVTVRYANPSSPKKPRKLNYSITTNRIDKVKAKRSLIANFIHYLDARLCLSVIFLCKQENICVWTNHDCFYSHPTHATVIRNLYFKAYKTLLLEHDLINRFLYTNKCKLTLVDQRLLKKFKQSRLQILTQLEKGDLKQSPFCLN